MASSGGNSQAEPGGREARYSDARVGGEERIDEPSLLDEVLSQTAAASQAEDLSADPALQPFLEVAQAHRGKPFVLDPVVVDLVAAALHDELRGREVSPELRGDVFARVAATIFDDPVCHDRLQTFWMRLSAVSS